MLLEGSLATRLGPLLDTQLVQDCAKRAVSRELSSSVLSHENIAVQLESAACIDLRSVCCDSQTGNLKQVHSIESDRVESDLIESSPVESYRVVSDWIRLGRARSSRGLEDNYESIGSERRRKSSGKSSLLMSEANLEAQI